MRRSLSTPPPGRFLPRLMFEFRSVQLWVSEWQKINIKIDNESLWKATLLQQLSVADITFSLTNIQTISQDVMRWVGCLPVVIHTAVWWGQLLNGQHKCYGTEDVSQDRGNPAHWAIIWAERKERKLVWRCVTSRSLCFRKGVGAAQLRNVSKKLWLLGGFS